VPAPGDYDDEEIDEMMNGRGNQTTRRKPAHLPLCPPQMLHACPDANQDRRGGKPATKRLSYVTAKKTTNYGVEKMYLLYIFPLSSMHLRLRCSNFFNPSKENSFGCAANRKRQRLISTTTYLIS
jgi:hypothetical protein